MSNPYPYGALGERWTVDQPTTKANLDKARIKTDHLKWILDDLGIEGDGETVLLYSSPLIWKTGDTGTDIFVAIWLDPTDTSNPKIRGKFAVGAAPTVVSATDGEVIFSTTTTGPTF